MLHSVPPAARLTRTCVVFVHKEKCLFLLFFVLEVFLYKSLFFCFMFSTFQLIRLRLIHGLFSMKWLARIVRMWSEKVVKAIRFIAFDVHKCLEQIKVVCSSLACLSYSREPFNNWTKGLFFHRIFFSLYGNCKYTDCGQFWEQLNKMKIIS